MASAPLPDPSAALLTLFAVQGAAESEWLPGLALHPSQWLMRAWQATRQTGLGRVPDVNEWLTWCADPARLADACSDALQVRGAR